MYELVRVSEHCSYVQSPAKIGVVELGGGDVCLIDSGNDKNAGRKVRQILDREGWRLTAICARRRSSLPCRTPERFRR